LARPVGKGRLGIVLGAHAAEGGAAIFQACATGVEGIVFNRLAAPYRCGRSPDWLKVGNPGTGLSGRLRTQPFRRYPSAGRRMVTAMPTPIRVSCVKRSAVNGLGVEGLGGTWRDRPWYLSERSLIQEIDQPAERRQWDFYVQAGPRRLPLIVSWADRRKYLTAEEPLALLKLPEWPQELDRSIPS
jgi:hypothetical protein